MYNENCKQLDDYEPENPESLESRKKGYKAHIRFILGNFFLASEKTEYNELKQQNQLRQLEIP